MNAVIMDNAVVGESTDRGRLRLRQGRHGNPARALVAGVPAKVMRPLSEEEIAWKSDGTRTYQDFTRRLLATLVEAEALTAVEPGRKRFDLPEVVPLVELKKR